MKRRLLVLLVALLVVGGLAQLAAGLLRVENLRAPIESRLSSLLGLDVTLGGEISLSLFPRLHFDVADLRVANPPDRSWPLLLQAGNVELRLDPVTALWHRRLEIDALEVTDAEIHLEEDAEGALVLPPGLAGERAAPSPPAGPATFSVERVSFERLALYYRPRAGDRVTDLRFEELVLASDPDADVIRLRAHGTADGGPFDLTGRLGPLRELLAPTRPYPFELRGRLFEAALDASGSLAQPARLEGLDVVWSVSLPDFGRHLRARGMAVPALGAVDARGRVAQRAGEDVFALSDLVFESRGEGSHVQVRGAVGDLLRRTGVALDVDARATDLSLLAPHFEDPMPWIHGLGVSLRARLSDRDGVVAVQDLTLEAGVQDQPWVRVGGFVRDLTHLSGVDLSGTFGEAALRHLAGSLHRPLPDLGSVEGVVEISDADGSLGVERFHLKAASDELSLSVSGAFDDLRELDEIGVDVKLEARDLEVLARLFGGDQPPIGPVVFAGRVSGSDEMVTSSGSAQVGRSRLEGDWQLRLAGRERPRLDAKVRSEHLRLEDLGVLDAAADAEAPGRPPRDADQRLPLWMLHELDGRLEAHVARVTGGRELDLQDVSAVVTLDGGLLEVRDFSTTYERGFVRGALRVDERASATRWNLFVDATHVDMARLASLLPGDRGSAGLASLWLDLDSAGDTPRLLLQNLAGDARGKVSDGQLASEYARMFVTNLARVVFPTLGLVPDDRTPLACLRFEFDVDDGVAEVRSLVLSGGSEGVTGSGRIDFANGRYALDLVPHTTRPGLISVAAEVRVSGPLEAPEIKPVRRTMARYLAGGLISNVLRPAEAARRILVRGRGASGPEDPCAGPIVSDEERARRAAGSG
ncbi:MAG: AsmA family protein [Myxococcota bacterium]